MGQKKQKNIVRGIIILISFLQVTFTSVTLAEAGASRYFGGEMHRFPEHGRIWPSICRLGIGSCLFSPIGLLSQCLG